MDVDDIYGCSKSSDRFISLKKESIRYPILVREGSYVLRWLAHRPNNRSNYIVYNEKDLHEDRIPCIEFEVDNHTLSNLLFNINIKEDKIPMIVLYMIENFIKNCKTTDTKPLPVNYLKLYIAVLDEVPDHIVPTLVAHSVLGNHLWIEPIDVPITDGCGNVIEERGLYSQWLKDSFRKCVVKVNQKEFDKISKLPLTYLGHENKTLDGKKSCAIAYPVWHLDTPKVLKFSKLWNTTCDH